MLKRVIVLLFFVCFATKISLAGRFNQMGNFFRGLSMGNTGVSSARDSDALFYNPAALANVQNNFLSLTTQYNFGADIKNINKDFTNILNTPLFLVGLPTEAANFLKNHPENSKIGSLVAISVNYQAIDRGFNISGVYAYETDNIYTIDRSATNFKGSFNLRFDQIAVVGLSYPFKLGEYVIGANIKLITRTAEQFDYFLSDANGGSPPKNSYIGGLLKNKTKSAVGGDIGFLYRKPGFLRFRAGISIINIGGLNFSDKDFNWPQEVNIGASIGPTIGRFRLIVAADYRDLLYANTDKTDGKKDTSFIKRTHFGIELGYYVENKTLPLLNLRAGLNQGLLTLGLEMDFFFGRTLIVGYSYHNENIGESGTNIEVPNHVIYLSLGF